ncbi:MAG TPA: hypothetical protein VEC35_17095 [Noviherbaspirillum sp.]|nr:hypothetical protein [Noviherbaspirillum sp.]
MTRATETITMSMREVDRLKTLQAVADGNLPAAIAASRLGLSKRQVNRLLVRLRSAGKALRNRLQWSAVQRGAVDKFR